MSNTVAESQPSTVVSKKRSVAPVVWLIVLVVAVLAFGAAVVWAGGINEALVLVGLSSPATAAQPVDSAGRGRIRRSILDGHDFQRRGGSCR